MSTTVRVNTRALRRRFTLMVKRAANFEAVLRWALHSLEESHAANFAADGALSGKPWTPLDSGYASWKLEHYGAGGILVRTGTLRSSLTDWNSRGSIREIGLSSATFGTNIEYAGWHQYGTRHMASREPVFVGHLFGNRTAKAVGEHIMYGTIGNVYGDLKGAVFI